MKVYAKIQKAFEIPQDWDQDQIQAFMDKEGAVAWSFDSSVFSEDEDNFGYWQYVGWI